MTQSRKAMELHKNLIKNWMIEKKEMTMKMREVAGARDLPGVAAAAVVAAVATLAHQTRLGLGNNYKV